MNSHNQLRVFLSYSSADTNVVHALYTRLKKDGFTAWLDEENLSAGQDRRTEIPKAVRNSDVVLICLSHEATTKAGAIHKEITYALDVAEEQPEGTIFVVPIRLDDCDVPERLSHLQYVNYFKPEGYDRLVVALQNRALSLGINVDAPTRNWCVELSVMAMSARRKFELGLSKYFFFESGDIYQLDFRVKDRLDDEFLVSFEFHIEIGEMTGTQMSHLGINEKQAKILMGPITRRLDRLRPGTTYDPQIETLLKNFFASSKESSKR